MNHITDKLAVTTAQHVRALADDHGFDCIVTMGYWGEMGYGLPELSDTGDEFVFPDGPHEFDDFERAVDAIRDALAEDKHVLVHCQAGCSRSPSACIAVIALEEDLSYEDAYWRVKRARDQTNPTEELEASARRYIEENR